MSEARSPTGPGAGEATLRLDKWLWYARLCKSRALASRLCDAARVRVSGTLVRKAHFALRVGDVVTLPWGPQIRVLRVRALGRRRGPPAEARSLYDDLAPPPASRPAGVAAEPAARRPAGSGRPTKAERRAVERLRNGS